MTMMARVMKATIRLSEALRAMSSGPRPHQATCPSGRTTSGVDSVARSRSAAESTTARSAGLVASEEPVAVGSFNAIPIVGPGRGVELGARTGEVPV